MFRQRNGSNSISVSKQNSLGFPRHMRHNPFIARRYLNILLTYPAIDAVHLKTE